MMSCNSYRKVTIEEDEEAAAWAETSVPVTSPSSHDDDEHTSEKDEDDGLLPKKPTSQVSAVGRTMIQGILRVAAHLFGSEQHAPESSSYKQHRASPSDRHQNISSSRQRLTTKKFMAIVLCLALLSLVIRSLVTFNEIISSVKRQKYFVIHVGPQKTATTFLQGVANSYAETTLRKDNYKYIGKPIKPGPMYKALRDRQGTCRQDVHSARVAGEPMPECWVKGFVPALKSFGTKSILMSSEDLKLERLADYPEWWRAVEEASEALGYKVIVVVAYRRLYEWLPSAHYEKNYGAKSNRDWRDWPSGNNTSAKRVQPFAPDFLRSEYVDRKNGTSMWFKWTPSVYHAIPDFVDTKVLNLHTEHSSTSVKFFCDLLPDATHTCNHINASEASNHAAASANAARSLFYDALTTAAADASMIDTSVQDRFDLARKARQYHEQELQRTALDFQVVCPPEESTSLLLEASLAWEKELMPDMDAEDSHREGFQEYIKKKKYCFIDLEATLKEDEWKTFFQRFSK